MRIKYCRKLNLSQRNADEMIFDKINIRVWKVKNSLFKQDQDFAFKLRYIRATRCKVQ